MLPTVPAAKALRRPARRTALIALGLLAPLLALAPAQPAGAIGEAPGALVVKRTYRLALLSDPSYAAAVAPGLTGAAADAAVSTAKQTLVDQLNAIFMPELAIRFELAPGTGSLNLDTVAEATAANGPCGAQACFTVDQLSPSGPGCGDELMLANRNVIGQLIGAHSYDIGHLLLGYAGGAASYNQSAGIEYRAYGCSSSATPTGTDFVVDLMARELGRQLGAQPTSDSFETDLCANERFGETAVEPGSGSSIMGLAGRCGADNLQAHPDPYFSTVSQDQIGDYVFGRIDSVPADSTAAEVQSVALIGFDGSDSFRLNFGGAKTAVIQNGLNYTATDIKTAVLATIPSAAISKVRGFWNSGLSVDARGFEMTFASFTNVVNPTLEVVSGSFTASVNDLDEGGQQNLGGTPSTTANHNPVATAPADRTIPVRTPFALTGTGTDADGDPLAYQWQQIDVDGSGVALAVSPKTDGPLFRMLAPGSSPTRSFPALASVVAGNTNAATGTCPAGPAQSACFAEWLPTADYADALHLSLVVRDRDELGGGVAYDDMTLTLNKAVGPFRVTSQASPTTVTGGDVVPITWTANTSSLATNVKITLSTDGGLTFPTVLTASTANDGAHTVTLPQVEASAARIKVEAVDNYFYDVSHADLTIQAPPSGLTVGTVPGTAAGDHTDGLDFSFPAETTNGTADVLTATVSGGSLPAGLSLAKTAVSGSGVVPGSASWALAGATTATPGTYPVTIQVSDGVVTESFPVTLTVTPETATATYDGPTEVDAPTSGPDAVDIELTADVVEEVDATPGSLATATLTFRDQATDEVLCVADPVTAGAPGAGTATCTMSADLGFDPRTYQVVLEVGGAWSGGSAAPTQLVVSPPPPSLVVTGMPEAVEGTHTDALSVTFDATTSAGPSSLVNAEVVDGDLPAGVTLVQTAASDQGVVPGTATYAIAGIANDVAGEYPVTIDVADGTITRTYDVVVTVAPEGATATYDGPTSVAADQGGPAAVSIPLSVTIAQDDDGSLGVLTTGSGTFRDEATGQTLCSGVAVVATGTDPGTATCDYEVDLPAFGGRTLEVSFELGGSWTGGTAAPVDVVITSPDPDPAPDTTITSGPPAWHLSSGATMRFASSQAGSTFTCTLDGQPRACSGNKVNLGNLTPGTHAFTATATNSQGTSDPTPAAYAFTVVQDDRALRTKGRGWQRSKAGKAYRKTLTQTRTRKVELTYDVVGTTALALVASTAPTYGTVKVYLGGRLLRTVKLKGKASVSKLFEVASFTSPVSGTVRIVTSTRKLVRIDGLGVRT